MTEHSIGHLEYLLASKALVAGQPGTNFDDAMYELSACLLILP